jgi:hypothetical protein
VVEVELDSKFLSAGADGLIAGRADLVVVNDEPVGTSAAAPPNSWNDFRATFADLAIDS